METSSTLRHLLAEERTLDAWAALQQHDSWETWSDPLNLIEAGRVLSACGDQWKAEKMRWRAWTLSPETPEAAYYRVSRIYRRHGACEALRWLDCHRPATEAVPSSVAEADILAMRARILAVFRDFTAADALMQRALGAFPDHAWLWMEHAGLLRAQDRYEEALDASARLIELAPWRNWAVRTRVDLLQLQNRDAEALDLVSEAVSRTQNGYLAVLLASAHESAGRDADILRALDLAEARLPLADRSDRRWIAARRSDAHHRLGETEAALAQARVAAELGYGYYKPMVERLSAPPPAPRRVRLPVGFVRQHHMTCAPATVAAITGYWGAAIDHQAMARDICYDGTPDHAERAWLQERGWLVREFTVDWDAAVALLDRGCPFMIVTTAVGSAHMQAVIGYDSTLRTFLVRDPYLQTFQEWNAEPVLKEQAAYGPRGVLVLPAAEKGRASDLTLPDEMILDEWFAFRRACHRHDRPAAQAALEGLERLGPGHVLALRARRDLAHYDGHVPGALAPVGALRERFPEDVNLQLEEIDLLERLGREHEARALVEKLGAGISKAFTLQRRRAETRIADARTASSAGRILRRLVRLSPGADHLRAYADFLWDAGERAEATRLYRLAATSADKVEAHWRVYFNASRQLGIEAECLALLRERFARWGDRAPYPAMTLHGVLADLDRDLEADEVLAEARRRLPKDGDLALYAAGRAARLSRHEEAEAILAEARPWCVPAAWSRVAARAAEIAAEHARALGLWRELLALDPANVEAQESCARLLRITEGRAAALAHLRAAGASLPRLEPLHRLVIEWLRAEPAEEALAAVEARLALVGEDAWLLRERAFVLRRLGRAEEGLASARIALAMEPRQPASHYTLLRCLHDLRRFDEAAEAGRAAIRLDIDATHLFSALVGCGAEGTPRVAAVRFIAEELCRQISFHGACLEFAPVARGLIDQDELVSVLRRIRGHQPDHWATRSALAACLGHAGKREEALIEAEENTRRFPLVPRVWLDLSMLRQEAGDLGGEIDALRRTLALSPAWGLASRRLSIALERHNDTAQAEQTLRRAIRLNPADAFNHGWLGDLFWRSGRHEEALVALEDALCHDPSYEWAWDQLHAWSLGMRRESRAIALAAQLTTARQGESSVWLRLVRLRFDDPAPEGNLAALDRAEALDPRDPDVHDLRADLLARHRRWAEALRACRPPIFGTDVPHTLLGREAWVRAASGRRQEAIEAMQAVLARHPDYVWGLSNLVEWLAQAKRHKEAIEAAKRWAWLAPDSPAPRGWIGSSQRALGEVREARATYERALERFPDYLYAAHELLDIHLEARDFPAAERVARQIGQHGGQAEGLRARALVERRRGGWKQTAEALAKLARMPDASGGQLRQLAQELAQSGKQALARGALAPALRDPAAHREVAGVWLEAARPLDLVRLLWAAWRARSVPPHRQALVTGLIDQLAERRSMAGLRLLRLLAARPLRDNPEWWGEMGYAFTYLSRWRSALRWMHDWREREHLRPYMLSNIALCHFQLGRPGPALEAVRRGLEHPPTEIRPKLSGWLAVESALAGDLAAAEEALADSSPGPNQHFDQALHALARRLVAFERLGPAARKEALREELDELAKLETGHSSVASDAGMRRHFRRARMRAAWLAGSAWERFMQRVRRGPAAARERETAAGFQFNWLHYLVAFLAIKALIAMLSTR